MRGLQTSDIFTFSKMIKKMQLKEDLKTFLDSTKNADNNINVALDVIMLILENLNNAENEFYNFVAPISEKTEDELKVLPINELIEILKNIYADVDFASFFKLAAK